LFVTKCRFLPPVIEEKTVQVTPAPFSEKLIVQYLLGELSEEQRVQMEDQAFQDEQSMQSILDVEADLIDEYVRDEFPVSKRKEFEKFFLASPERRRKVEFARALASVTAESQTFAGVQVATPVVREPGLLAFIRGLSPASAFAFAAAALIVVVGAGLLIRDSIRLRAELGQLRAEHHAQDTQRRQLEEQLASERARSESLARQLQQENIEVPNPAPPPDKEQIGPQTPSGILAVTLLPGISRSSANAPRVEIAPESQTLKLTIGVDRDDDYPRFRAELRGPKGERVMTRENLLARPTRNGRSFSLNVPASSLVPGRYEVAVQGLTGGTAVDVGFYYFEVTRK
jgi:hypothetical protein